MLGRWCGNFQRWSQEIGQERTCKQKHILALTQHVGYSVMAHLNVAQGPEKLIYLLSH